MEEYFNHFTVGGPALWRLQRWLSRGIQSARQLRHISRDRRQVRRLFIVLITGLLLLSAADNLWHQQAQGLFQSLNHKFPAQSVGAALAAVDPNLQLTNNASTTSTASKSLPADAAATPPPGQISRTGRYAYGQCTYYVASRRPIPAGWGDARNWYANAQRAGFATGAVPVVGAVAWTPRGSNGHVAYVEQVDGNQVQVAEMNYAGWNRVDRRWVASSAFKYIY